MGPEGTAIDETSRLGPGVRLGRNVEIGPFAFLDGAISIGDGARLCGGVVFDGALTIGARCHIESGVALTRPNGDCAPVVIGEGVYIGAGSVLSAGVRIGMGARIAAGTVITRDVPPYALVSGNPAVIGGYLQSEARGPIPAAGAAPERAVGAHICSVAGVTIHTLRRHEDLRGALCAGEFPRDIPFEPKRYFLVFDVPSSETRGEHAHRVCEQYLTCVSGSIAVVVDDGENREEIELRHPTQGIYIPPGVWGIQYKFSADAVLLVFASHAYDSDDYIRNYSDFLAERSARR